MSLINKVTTRPVSNLVGCSNPVASVVAKPAIDALKKTDVAKKIEKGIVGTAKKVGKGIKKFFGFQYGGKVRRPPIAYKKGGRVRGGRKKKNKK